MSKHKHFEVQRAGDVCVVHLIDPKLFDTLIVTELQDDLMELIDAEQPSKLVVNFASVTHCSTACAPASSVPTTTKPVPSTKRSATAPLC